MVSTVDSFKQSVPRLLINEEFRDIESLNGVFGWDLDWRQIEPGPLFFRLTAFGHADVNVIRVEFNRSFHQIGKPPPGAITLGLPDLNSGALKSNGLEISAGTLINFNYKNSLDTVNQGAFGGFVISLSENALRTIFAECGLDENLVSGVNQIPFWGPSCREHEQLRQILQALTEVALSEGSVGLEKWCAVFNQDLAAVIAGILSGESHQPTQSAPKFQLGVLQRALQIISEYDQMPNSVKALSLLAGTSWSTLERAFLNEFNITPKAYMNARRLAAVQVELVRHGHTATIQEIANQWGFHHMGSFAADYKKQFGELPSETLARLAVTDKSE
jgi:AraC family ethanolamine operon transcriptional activator